MTVGGISLRDLHHVWADLWPLLEPAVKRSPDFSAVDRAGPDVLARLIARDAQLWAVYEGDRPIAAIVTTIQVGEEKRCLLWLIGGSRVSRVGGRFPGHLRGLGARHDGLRRAVGRRSHGLGTHCEEIRRRGHRHRRWTAGVATEDSMSGGNNGGQQPGQTNSTQTQQTTSTTEPSPTIQPFLKQLVGSLGGVTAGGITPPSLYSGSHGRDALAGHAIGLADDGAARLDRPRLRHRSVRTRR